MHGSSKWIDGKIANVLRERKHSKRNTERQMRKRRLREGKYKKGKIKSGFHRQIVITNIECHSWNKHDHHQSMEKLAPRV